MYAQRSAEKSLRAKGENIRIYIHIYVHLKIHALEAIDSERKWTQILSLELTLCVLFHRDETRFSIPIFIVENILGNLLPHPNQGLSVFFSWV